MDTEEGHEVLLAFVEKVLTSRTNVFVGIDPGADGAIAVIGGRNCCVLDIPTVKVARKRKGGKAGTTTKFNYPGIVSLFRLLKPIRSRLIVALEVAQVQIRGKGSNAYTGFRVGVGYGLWPLFLCSKGYYVEEFAPVKWKRGMGLIGKDKEASRHKALGMFPSADIRRKKDHNRAEALLLAEYMRREYYGRPQ